MMDFSKKLEGCSSGRSFTQINVLVVDDDPTCLNVITRCLQKMNYHVVATTNPIDALSTLRRNYGKFDIVLSDVHMPQMSGLHLLSLIEDEFQLPVVLMSADSDKNIMLKGLEDGASFYIVKPITQESLKKLWQFAISRKKPSVITKSPNNHNNNNDDNTSISPSNYGQTTLLKMSNEDINNGVKRNKRPRLIWTTSLHNKFLEAVNKFGIEKAVPKKILQYMNVPGLRRENVASHLQKYRIFLKRISEMSISTKNGILNICDERPLRSSFMLNEIAYLTNSLQQQYQEFLIEREKGSGKTQGNSSGDTNPNYKKIIDSICDDDILIYPSKGNTQNKVTGANCIETVQSKINNNNNNNNNNYVGIRISPNGELVSTLNNHANKDNTLFGATQEITSNQDMGDKIRQVDKDININHIRGMSFGNDFEFGYFDLHDRSLENFGGIDKGILFNDDISFNKYYDQDVGQQIFGEFNKDDNISKFN